MTRWWADFDLTIISHQLLSHSLLHRMKQNVSQGCNLCVSECESGRRGNMWLPPKTSKFLVRREKQAQTFFVSLKREKKREREDERMCFLHSLYSHTCCVLLFSSHFSYISNSRHPSDWSLLYLLFHFTSLSPSFRRSLQQGSLKLI